MVELDSDIIVLAISSEQPELNHALPGAYHQLVVSIGEERYLAVCDLLEVQNRREGPVMILIRPSLLHVMQRRRCARWVPGKIYPVHVSWQDSEGQATPSEPGQLQDLSFHGMAIRMADSGAAARIAACASCSKRRYRSSVMSISSIAFLGSFQTSHALTLCRKCRTVS